MSPLSFGNTGNIGLPLAYFAFGEIGLGYAVLVLSITSILSFSIGIWFVSGETSFFKTLKKFKKNQNSKFPKNQNSQKQSIFSENTEVPSYFQLFFEYFLNLEI